MARYRLKHDLPNAKAGDIFDVDQGDDSIFKVDEFGRETYFFEIDEVTDFNYWFEEIEEMPGSVLYKPAKGSTCWRLDGQMTPTEVIWTDSIADNELRDLGLIFKTYDEASLARKKRFAKTRIQRAALQTGFRPKWDQLAQPKWYLVYNLENHRLVPVMAGPANSGAIAYYGEPGTAIRAGRKYRREYLLCLGVIDDPEAPLPEIDNENDNGTLGFRQGSISGQSIGWWGIDKGKDDSDDDEDESDDR